MKITLRKLVALALFTITLVGVTFAQSYGHEVRATIPFNFYAGSKLLPAGDYIFMTNAESYSVAIAQSGKGFKAILQGSPNQGLKYGAALLTFRTNGDGAYALQKVQGSDFGVSFNADKVLAHLAWERPADATQTVIARLTK